MRTFSSVSTMDFSSVSATRDVPATLTEIFAETPADGAVTGFTLALLKPGSMPLLWVQDLQSRKKTGVPFFAGMMSRLEVLRVDATKPLDVLWSVEQGLCCAGLAGVVAEIWGNADVVGFSATRRLAMRSERHGVPCYLLRWATRPTLSAARERWRVSSLPSLHHPDDACAPGRPQWRVELFRSRFRPAGRWVVRYDRHSGRVDFDHGLKVAGGNVSQGPARQSMPNAA